MIYVVLVIAIFFGLFVGWIQTLSCTADVYNENCLVSLMIAVM